MTEFKGSIRPLTEFKGSKGLKKGSIRLYKGSIRAYFKGPLKRLYRPYKGLIRALRALRGSTGLYKALDRV